MEVEPDEHAGTEIADAHREAGVLFRNLVADMTTARTVRNVHDALLERCDLDELPHPAESVKRASLLENDLVLDVERRVAVPAIEINVFSFCVH